MALDIQQLDLCGSVADSVITMTLTVQEGGGVNLEPVVVTHQFSLQYISVGISLQNSIWQISSLWQHVYMPFQWADVGNKHLPQWSKSGALQLSKTAVFLEREKTLIVFLSLYQLYSSDL